MKTETVISNKLDWKVSRFCYVCGNNVGAYDYIEEAPYICDKCKQAILWAKEKNETRRE